MTRDDPAVLLAELAARPSDHELRRRAAEALDDAGRYDEALAVLAPLVNLTGHDLDTELPCLCRGCLARVAPTATVGEMRFVRSFAVVGTRVLHFWMLTEQEVERAKVRGSVAAALRARLAAQKERA